MYANLWVGVLETGEPMTTDKSELDRPRTLVLPPAPYALALLASWWLERKGHALSFDPGPAALPLAGLLVGAGLALFLWTLYTFWRHHTTVNPYKAAAELCTSGPFAFSRNPIYLGDWFVYLGLMVWIETFWPLVFAPLVWLIVRYGVIRHEEAHLEAKFGEPYRAYRASVRRWL